MSLNTQFLTLWMMFACGCMLGGLLDTYRVVSGEVRMKRWLIPVFDILYWLLAMVLVFRVLYWSNLGEVRMFVFLGLIIGLVTYYALISKFIILVVRTLIRWLRTCVVFAVRIFRIVVIAPLSLLYRSLLALLMFFGAATIFLCKFVLQLVYPLWKLLRRPLIYLAKIMRLDAAVEWFRTWINRIRRKF